MKNKTKKILAGLGLGLVGMGCLTGCSISEEQKAALDLITEKSDEIVNLLKENLEHNNNSLSKEEAAEKILLARNRLQLVQFDELEFTIIQREYYGFFDKLEGVYSSDELTPSRWLYRKSGDNKVFARADGTEFDRIITSNFKTDEHLKWEDDEEAFSSREYETDDFNLELDHFDDAFRLGEVSAQDVKDIEITDDGYIFKILKKITDGDETFNEEIIFNVSFDGYITSFEVRAVFEIEDGDYRSSYLKGTYKYKDIDFSALDAKIAELNAQ